MSMNSAESPVATTEKDTFRSLMREIFSGTDRDFTQGSIIAGLIILAVPMTFEMAMEGVFAIFDTFFVAKLGAEAVAVVGFTESVLALVYAVAVGLSIGATATVARRIGEKDHEEAARSAVHMIYLGLIVSVIMGLIGLIFAPDILRLLGAEEAVVTLGTPFMQIMFGTSLVIVFLFLLNAIFRGAGDAAIAMRVLIFANAINLVLDPLLIFGLLYFPEMGVTGAAVSTVIGRGAGVVYAAWALFFRDNGGRIEIRKRHWKLDLTLLWSLVRLSSVAVLQFLISTASWSGLVVILAAFGSVAMAGYQIGMRVIVFIILLAAGIANATATLVGQNLGAGQPERAERTVWIAGAINAVFLGFIGMFFVIFADPVVRIFTADPEILIHGKDCLRIIGYGYAFYGLGMVMESSFNGAGDTLTPTYLNLFIFWLFEIPLAYLLAHTFGWGPSGVFWAITVAFSVLAVVAAFLFRRGKWKTQTV
ncbi:MAG: MATE family efflux transporter [Acidobacteria bacterium]|nr:MATE family efflux transporter [Acidobacteriota bacterium]